MLLTATAQDTEPSGDFGATTPAPSAPLAAGDSNGTFSWTYPVGTSDVASSLAPDLKFDYSSQSVDGRSASMNNQANGIGGQSNTGVGDTAGGEWHLECDDGTKAEKFANTARVNGDIDGEHWRVITPDGTRHYFGYNRPAGWATGKEETNFTWTVPVYGTRPEAPATPERHSWAVARSAIRISAKRSHAVTPSYVFMALTQHWPAKGP